MKPPYGGVGVQPFHSRWVLKEEWGETPPDKGDHPYRVVEVGRSTQLRCLGFLYSRFPFRPRDLDGCGIARWHEGAFEGIRSSQAIEGP